MYMYTLGPVLYSMYSQLSHMKSRARLHIHQILSTTFPNKQPTNADSVTVKIKATQIFFIYEL